MTGDEAIDALEMLLNACNNLSHDVQPAIGVARLHLKHTDFDESFGLRAADAFEKFFDATRAARNVVAALKADQKDVGNPTDCTMHLGCGDCNCSACMPASTGIGDHKVFCYGEVARRKAYDQRGNLDYVKRSELSEVIDSLKELAEAWAMWKQIKDPKRGIVDDRNNPINAAAHLVIKLEKFKNG